MMFRIGDVSHLWVHFLPVRLVRKQNNYYGPPLQLIAVRWLTKKSEHDEYTGIRRKSTSKIEYQKE